MAKYCAKCNAFFEDNEVNFCAVCGSSEFIAAQAAPVEEAPAPEAPAAEAPMAEAPAAEAPAGQVFASVAPLQNASAITIENPAENAPRKKSVIAKILLIAIPVVLAALIAFNFQFLYGWALRVFGSDASYLKYVEKKSFSTYAGSMGDALDNYSANADGASLKVEGRLKISDSFNDAMSDLGGEVDLSWLDDMTLTVNENLKENKGLYSIMLGIENRDIIGADVYLDNGGKDIYVAFKEITDKVLHIDSSEAITGNAAIMSVLPDSDVLEKLVNKYVAIALDDIDEVSSKSETVTVGDVSQKLLVIEYKISEKTVMRISRDVLKELKEDPQVAEIVNNLEKSLRENGLIDESDDLYDELIDEIDATLEEIDDEIEDASNKSIFTVRDYVDAGHKIVGRELASKNADETLKYIVVEDGGKYYAEVNVADEIRISGNYEKKNGIINGRFDIKASGQKVASIKVTDFDVDGLKENELNGTVRITPDSKFLKKNLDSQYASLISLAKPAIEFEFSGNSRSGATNVKLLSRGEEIIGVYYVVTITDEAEEVNKPSGDIIEADDEDEMLEFAEDIDLTAVIRNLRKTSVPEEYIAAIEDLVEMLAYDYSQEDYYPYEDYDDYWDDDSSDLLFDFGDFDTDDYGDTDW